MFQKKKRVICLLVLIAGMLASIIIILMNWFEILRLEWNTKIDVSDNERIASSNYIVLPREWTECNDYKVSVTEGLEVILFDSYKDMLRIGGEKVEVVGGRPCCFFITEESVNEGAEIVFYNEKGERLTYQVLTFGKEFYLLRKRM